MGEVGAGGGAEADHRNSEHPTVTDREFVLPKGIRQDLGRLEVMDSVDLDNHAVRRPLGVEVEGSVGPRTTGLPLGFRESEVAAEPGELQLADGLRAAGQVNQHRLQEAGR